MKNEDGYLEAEQFQSENQARVTFQVRGGFAVLQLGISLRVCSSRCCTYTACLIAAARAQAQR